MKAVKKKWETLKATYYRSKKRIASGSAASGKAYKYETQLSFLDDTAEPRPSKDLGGTKTQVDVAEELYHQ